MKLLSSALLPRVEATIRRHALFPSGASIVVACSGGPDSLALLGLLHELSPTLGWHLTAVYVDHALRAAASQEGHYVCEVARRLGVPGRVCRVALNLHECPGHSVQEAARLERYRLLQEVAQAVGADYIATGHTADDQAETLLLRLAHGTGSQGLAGIPYRNGMVRRPILDLRRAETEEYCRAWGISPVRDPSNDEDVYLRNKIRHHILPALIELNPRAVESLHRLAETAQAENAWLDDVTATTATTLGWREDAGWWVDSARLQQHPLALQRRLLRWFFRNVPASTGVCVEADETGVAIGGYIRQELDFSHVDDLLGIALCGKTGAQLPLPGGVLAVKEKNGLWMGLPQTPTPFTLALQVPGRTDIDVANLAIVTSLLEGRSWQKGELQNKAEAATPWRPTSKPSYLNGAAVKGKLMVRSRRPGDRYQPVGAPGSKKLQDIMVDAGVPRRWRDRLPVITDDMGIVWVAGLHPAERVKVELGEGSVVQLALVLNFG